MLVEQIYTALRIKRLRDTEQILPALSTVRQLGVCVERM